MGPALSNSKGNKICAGVTMAQDTKCRHHIRDRFQFRDKESGGFRDGFTVPDGWRELKNEEMSLRTFHSRCQSLTKNTKGYKTKEIQILFQKTKTTKQQPKPGGTYKAPCTGIDSKKEPALFLQHWQPSHGLGTGNSGFKHWAHGRIDGT